MTRARSGDQLTPRELAEVQRVALDLAHHAAHRDTEALLALVETLDEQEQADGILALAALLAVLVHRLAGPGVLCAITGELLAATERKAAGS